MRALACRPHTRARAPPPPTHTVQCTIYALLDPRFNAQSSQALMMTMGSGPGQQPATRLVYDSIVKQMKAKEYHAFISNGDLSYARVRPTLIRAP